MARGKKTAETRGGAEGKRTRRKDAARRPSISAKAAERVAGLFGAPARIMGPRLLFIASVVLLCALGLVMVYSASSITAFEEHGNASYFFDRQAVFLAAGAVICVVMAFIPYTFWGRPVVFIALWLVACALLSITAFGGGVSALGAERSISIAGFNLQPAEFAKAAVLVTIASLVAMLKKGELAFRPAIAFIVVAAVIPIFLIYRQPDLGTAIILIVGLLSLMVLAGFSWKPIIAIIGVFVVYVVFVCIIQPYHIDRIVAMFDPWLDPQGDGFQSIQSLYAFGSGGLFGTGIGLSRQKYLYLPEAHTDFIFAIIGEELGLVGTLFTVALFAVFIFSGIRICRSAPDLLGCLLSGGLTVMIGFQACVNMAQSCGIAPVTGKALPFVSYGGSSLVATLLMVGLILSVSRCSKVGAANERRRDNLMVLDGGGQRTQREPSAAAASARVIPFLARRRQTDAADARASRPDAGGQRARDRRGARDAEDSRVTRDRRRGAESRGRAGEKKATGYNALGTSADSPCAGRLDYVDVRGSREYATRERRVRTSSTSAPGRRPASDAASSRTRSAGRRGPSTKPANPSGTKRRY